jgi:hypothetical protein
MKTADEISVIASYAKNHREEMRAYVSTFRKKLYVNFRVFYCDDDGTWKPGKQGVAVHIERFADFAEMFEIVRERIAAEYLAEE